MTLQTTPPLGPRPSRRARVLRCVVLGLTGLIIIVALFHPVENWRGKRAWKNCRRQLEARGEVLDWAAFIPPPVPDEQNIFEAPNMAEWFVGRDTNELVELLDPKNLHDFVRRDDSNAHAVVVADLRVVRPDTDFNIENVDALLRQFEEGRVVYSRLHHSMSSAASAAAPLTSSLAAKTGAHPVVADASGSKSKIIPLIILDDVPLTDAITNLAREANIKYSLDPKIKFRQFRSRGRVEGPQNVSISWEDVTAEQALSDLLAHYNLQWLGDPKTGIAVVTVRDSTAPRMRGFPSLQEHMGQQVHNALDAGLTAPQGFTLIAGFAQIKPVRIVLRSGQPLAARQIMRFLPTNSVAPVIPGTDYLHAETGESNSFRIVLDRSQIYTAAEFLKWSDQFKSQFDVIRDALKRPYARMEGNYQQPFAIPIPNSRSFRLVSQTLAQRAQCYLLLGQPEDALRELMLVHQMLRLLEGKPASKPMTLVAAMLYVAVTGVYANVVADGLRIHAWHKTQLASIQEQLADLKLLPLLAEALRYERACGCRVLEDCLIATEEKIPAQSLETNRFPEKESHKIGPVDLLERGRKLGMPRGWFDQNLVSFTRLEQRAIDSLNLLSNIVSVERVNAWEREMQRVGARFRPYAFFAAIVVPNYARAFQTVARNQALADQALIACGLERYRLKVGQYPTTLDALSPDFIKALPRDVIGGDRMKYRCNGEGFVLYSIGWDEKDDGGMISTDTERGDWVWPSSTK